MVTCGRKKGRGRGEGEKREREKRKGAPSHPFLPNSPSFSLPHYPLPLSTPATQATTYTVRLQGLQNSKSNHFFTHRAVPYPGWYSFSKVIVEVIDETCEDGFAQKTKSSITVLILCSVYGLRFCSAHNYTEERLRVKTLSSLIFQKHVSPSSVVN